MIFKRIRESIDSVSKAKKALIDVMEKSFSKAYSTSQTLDMASIIEDYKKLKEDHGVVIDQLLALSVKDTSDGRISPSVKEWARNMEIPEEVEPYKFSMHSITHPALYDGFLRRLASNRINKSLQEELEDELTKSFETEGYKKVNSSIKKDKIEVNAETRSGRKVTWEYPLGNMPISMENVVSIYLGSNWTAILNDSKDAKENATIIMLVGIQVLPPEELEKRITEARLSDVLSIIEEFFKTQGYLNIEIEYRDFYIDVETTTPEGRTVYWNYKHRGEELTPDRVKEILSSPHWTSFEVTSDADDPQNYFEDTFIASASEYDVKAKLSDDDED